VGAKPKAERASAGQGDKRTASNDERPNKSVESSVNNETDTSVPEDGADVFASSFGDIVSSELDKLASGLLEESVSDDSQKLAAAVSDVPLGETSSGDFLPVSAIDGQTLPLEKDSEVDAVIGGGLFVLPGDTVTPQSLGLRVRLNASLTGRLDTSAPSGLVTSSASNALTGLVLPSTNDVSIGLSALAIEGGEKAHDVELGSLELTTSKAIKDGASALSVDLTMAGSKGGVDFSQLLGSLVEGVSDESAADPVSWQSTVQTLSGMSTVSYKMVDGLPVVSSVVSTPVGAAGWTEQVANQVAWFSSKNVTEAEIQLDPPELGPLQVKVSSTHDQTTVSFTSAHANVRDALDQGLARLKEMFAEQGLNLVDVDVSGHSAQDGQGDETLLEFDDGQADDADSSGADSIEADALTTVSIPKSIGLVNEVV
jgi:flagellar hook-length control protein FliK